jgi:hypothetical protein
MWTYSCPSHKTELWGFSVTRELINVCKFLDLVKVKFADQSFLSKQQHSGAILRKGAINSAKYLNILQEIKFVLIRIFLESDRSLKNSG